MSGTEHHDSVTQLQQHIEIFANDGRVVMSYCFLPDLLDSSLALTCEEGSARIGRMDVYAVRPTWPRTP